MNEDDIILPQAAPLSHLDTKQGGPRAKFDKRLLGLGLALIVAIGVAVTWRPEVTLPTPTNTEGTVASESSDATETVQSNARAPFAEAQHKLAREKAQGALSAFVEQQIQLEDSMQVQAWGADELADAMANAKLGDEEFLRENFDAALEAYASAAKQMEQLIAKGNELFRERLDEAKTLLNERATEPAAEGIAAALLIKPEDPEALATQQRIAKLPKVINLLRTAKNHELGGRYQAALGVYDEVANADPATVGLDALRRQARAGQTGENLTGHISRGFSALDTGRFEDARTAFNKALALDPGNDVALGGLAQVADEHDLDLIRTQKELALKAMQSEDWPAAVAAYQKVLNLDSNIQFAATGIRMARSHLRAKNLLTKIVGAPEKLSSEKLYLDATNILANAQALTQKGPVLDELVENVSDLLALYKEPVEVILLSDNATDVIVSNVGRIGFFERKTLSLRPGQYTIRGSQAGCRDIYLSVEVIPGIDELNVRCEETLRR